MINCIFIALIYYLAGNELCWFQIENSRYSLIYLTINFDFLLLINKCQEKFYFRRWSFCEFAMFGIRAALELKKYFLDDYVACA